MKRCIRHIVSGDRIRLQEDGFDLDLTYITPRIIAMSWPASTFFGKFYRNDINEVSRYLEKKHGQSYWVFNTSGNQYNPKPFRGRVNCYTWKDRHNPALVVIFQACQKMHEWLTQNDDNVVVVHCNAGKGRTGTLISSYMLYCGFADTAQNALTYYAWKRFASGRGVINPSSVRYVFYFEKALKEIIT